LKFENKSEASKVNESGWVDKIKESDHLDQNWLKKLLDLLPYKQNSNMVFDPNVLKQMKIERNGANEKVYAYACFMPPGRFSSSILYNMEHSQKSKGLYSM
jgi:hypothetical protein